MKRYRIPRQQDESEGGMDISSLVDICFLLLIYFIVTSVITPREGDISTGLGGPPDKVQPLEVDPMWISIDASGQIYSGQGVDRIPLDADPNIRELPQLEDSITVYKRGLDAMGHDCMVVIDADDAVNHQRVVDVLNTLAGLNIRKVTFNDQLDE